LPAAGPESAYVPPRTGTERTLAEIWAEVLGVERVGVEDNFFGLGGDSILSIQVVSRARRAGLPLATRDIFLHQTVAELAPVVVDQPHIGDADRVVDARGVTVRRADVLDRPPSGPQRQITKLGLLLLISVSRYRKAAACSGPVLVNKSTRLNPARAPHREMGPGR